MVLAIVKLSFTISINMTSLIFSHTVAFPRDGKYKQIIMNSSLALKIDVIDEELRQNTYNLLFVVPSTRDIISETLTLLKKSYHCKFKLIFQEDHLTRVSKT